MGSKGGDFELGDGERRKGRGGDLIKRGGGKGLTRDFLEVGPKTTHSSKASVRGKSTCTEKQN